MEHSNQSHLTARKQNNSAWKNSMDEKQVMETVVSENDGILEVFDVTWKEFRRKNSKIYGEKYLKGELLGKGTFASVYEVLDIRTLHRRAVKRFNLQDIEKMINGQEILRMIQTEGRLLKMLNHKNVVKVVDIVCTSNEKQIKGNSNGGQPFKLYFFMEYCTTSVEELIKVAPDGKLGQQQSLTYLLAVLDGLEYLHSYGVVHKDIKPQNMLVSLSGEVKITDLGVCEVLNKYDPQDMVRSTFGTKLYQPPEMYSSQDNLQFPGFPTDIWATGVTLYHMISGKYPFYSDSEIALMNMIMRQPFEVAPELRGDPALHDLIEGFLTKDPNQRIQIDQVRKHSWCKLSTGDKGQFVQVPPRKTGDKYSSMTMTPYLHQLHAPLKIEDNEILMTEETAADITRKLMVPIVRGNRSPLRQRRKSKYSINCLDRHVRKVLGVQR